MEGFAELPSFDGELPNSVDVHLAFARLPGRDARSRRAVHEPEQPGGSLPGRSTVAGHIFCMLAMSSTRISH